MQKKPAKNNSQLTPANIKNFKNMLLAKRLEILKNVTSMEHEALKTERGNLSNMPIHLADMGTDNFDQEFTLGLMDSERKLLVEINDALNRIEQGTYGICEGSGQPIPKARLKAIPWAKYGLEYARMLEKGMVKKYFQTNQDDYDFGEDEQDEGPEKPFQRKAI